MRRSVDFLIVGAARCGTRFLFDRSREHPGSGMCCKKETHFFDYEYHRGTRWYLKHFPDKGVAGEASVDYMFHPLAMYHVRRCLPAAKIVVALRNPIDRAYSHWALFRRERKEAAGFEAAITAESGKIAEKFRTFSYLSRGLYADQLYRIFALFPRKNVLVLKSEELFANPAAVLNRMWKHVGLAPRAPKPWQLVMNTHKGRYKPMAPKTREFLQRFYAEPNVRLNEMLGRKMGWD